MIQCLPGSILTGYSVDSTSHRAGYFSAAEATRTNVDMTGRTVNDRRDALDVRFPHAVAAPVGVADFDTKDNAFIANFTFSHLLHLLASG